MEIAEFITELCHLKKYMQQSGHIQRSLYQVKTETLRFFINGQKILQDILFRKIQMFMKLPVDV